MKLNKKVIILLAAMALTYPSAKYIKKNYMHDYVKSSEVISEMLVDKRNYSIMVQDVKKQINIFNEAINNKDYETLDNLFLKDCYGIPKSKRKNSIDSLLNKTPHIKFEYLSVKDGYEVGVSTGDDADVLVGDSISDLHFYCGIDSKLEYDNNGIYCVQIASFRDIDHADKYADSLVHSEFGSNIYTIDKEVKEGPSSGLWFVVRIGKFKDKEMAEAVKEIISMQLGVKDAFICQEK